MRSIALLTLMLLLSGCAVTGGSAEAICGIPAPQLEASGISPGNAIELDLYVERLRRACEGL